jgi:hypothetical protein
MSVAILRRAGNKRFAGAAAEWSPSALSALRTWLVADDPANTIISTLLAVIADKSGHVSATPVGGSASNRAAIIAAGLNGRNVWRKDGSTPTGAFVINDFSMGRNVPGLTLCAVSKLTSSIGLGQGDIFRVNNSAGVARAIIARGSYGSNWVFAGGRRLDSDSFQYVVNGIDKGTDWLIVVAVLDFQAASLTLSVNGTVSQLSPFQTAGNSQDAAASVAVGIGHAGPSPGSTSACNGDYAEMLVCHEAISSTERQKLEGYLAWQWGLVSTLPVDHPYKSAAPTM